MRLRTALAVFSVLALTVACVSPRKVNEEMLPFIVAGDHAGALTVLEEDAKDFGEKNEVLYHLERGMLLHYAGRWEESNQSFELAKRLAELHFTKSVSAEASTWVVNDNTRPYYGENFERALIHVFGALNYYELGLYDEALVEIRQLNFFLRTLVVDQGQTNQYSDDPFARYLAGILFEERGELDEAFIAYKKALDAYAEYGATLGVATPQSLLNDTALVARRIGGDAMGEFRERYGEHELDLPAEGTGRVILLHYNGRAPVKIDTYIDIAFGNGWAYVNKIDVEGESRERVANASAAVSHIAFSEQIRVAFPEYRRVPRTIERFDVRVLSANDRVARAEIVENIGAIAEKDLADRIHRIRGKAIARAAIKYAAAKAVEQVALSQNEGAVGLVASLVAVGMHVARTLSEVADKRAWFTVPDQIWMLQLDLEPGEQMLELTYRNAEGGAVSTEAVVVDVVPGRRSFVLVRTVQ
jgi:hypothetical protein